MSSMSPLMKAKISRLFLLEDTLINAAAKYDLRLHRSPAGIQAQLQSLSPQMLDSVQRSLNLLLNSFAKCQEEGADPWDDREFFCLSMQAMGVQFPSDFLKKLDRDDLIEGYDMNRIQIFRNMRFMETSSYSLLEILSYEWPLLFARASAITDKIISHCDELLWSANRTIPVHVAKHWIHEIRSAERQVCEVTFKYMTPLFSGPGKPAGVIATCQARAIEVDTQRDNLAFV